MFLAQTTLLQAMAGELPLQCGQLTLAGRVCLVPQQPWIFTGSVRSNILFGAKMEEGRYREVTSACALDRDLSAWGAGDATMVGESGVALSGGQRARIALARAAYRADRTDVYLLDAPLSALDPAVARHVLTRCLIRLMLARGKAVVVATHRTELLEEADSVVAMKEGRVELTTFRRDDRDNSRSKEAEEEEGSKYDHFSSLEVTNAGVGDLKNPPLEMAKEAKAEGSISLSTYVKYFQSSESTLCLGLVVALGIVAQVLFCLVDVFIGRW